MGVNGSVYTCFNTQPPEGGWRSNAIIMTGIHQVSTHSRPKAAGCRRSVSKLVYRFQHTAARRRLGGFAANDNIGRQVSTHSRPKAAGICFAKAFMRFIRFQHTAARRRLVLGCFPTVFGFVVSTHSRPKAAGKFMPINFDKDSVSTHSRPKAAGCFSARNMRPEPCFNTQPPEGGWSGRPFR